MPKTKAPTNENEECEICGGYALPGQYCFAIYLNNPEADETGEARPPDAYVHAPNLREARRTLLLKGNDGDLTSPFGMTNLWDYFQPRKRLPVHTEICYS